MPFSKKSRSRRYSKRKTKRLSKRKRQKGGGKKFKFEVYQKEEGTLNFTYISVLSINKKKKYKLKTLWDTKDFNLSSLDTLVFNLEELKEKDFKPISHTLEKFKTEHKISDDIFEKEYNIKPVFFESDSSVFDGNKLTIKIADNKSMVKILSDLIEYYKKCRFDKIYKSIEYECFKNLTLGRICKVEETGGDKYYLRYDEIGKRKAKSNGGFATTISYISEFPKPSPEKEILQLVKTEYDEKHFTYYDKSIKREHTKLRCAQSGEGDKHSAVFDNGDSVYTLSLDPSISELF